MLKCKNLHYHSLLQNVSLCFQPGEIHAIVGPNGAGKSTFLKVLAGIWKSTSGDVTWQGMTLQHKDRREISTILTLVPQNPTLSFDYSVEEFVNLGNYAHGRQASVEKYLEQVDAAHLLKRSILKISQGERQRIYIARALATQAEILLLDEPTASLDPLQQRILWRLLYQLGQSGKTLLVATHDLLNAGEICTHAAVIRNGCCTASGSYRDVLTPTSITTIFDLQD